MTDGLPNLRGTTKAPLRTSVELGIARSRGEMCELEQYPRTSAPVLCAGARARALDMRLAAGSRGGLPRWPQLGS